MTSAGLQERVEDSARTPEFGVERVLQVLRRRWVLIGLSTLLVGVAAFGYSRLQTKEYTASTPLLFGTSNLGQQISGLTSAPVADPTRQAATNVLLLQQGDIAAKTAHDVGHGLTTAAVQNAISVAPQGQSSLVTISATFRKPTLAAEVANAFANDFVAAQQRQARDTVRQALRLVEKQLAAMSPQQRVGLTGQALQDHAESLKVLGSLQTGNVQVVRAAAAPTSPSSPSPKRNTALGAILGLVLGLTLAFLLERLDRRLREPDDIEEAFGAPLLGVIPELSSDARDDKHQLVDGVDGPRRVALTHAAEPFRMLRAHLRYFNVDRDLRTLAIVSSAPGEGKTTIALNLSQAAASMGTRTLLMELDLRRPRLATKLGLPPTRGVSDVLIHSLELEDAVQTVTVSAGDNSTATDRQLDVLLAGPTPPNSAELLESEAMANLLRKASELYELVIVDTAPLAVVSDAIPLLRLVNGVIVVVRLGQSTREATRGLNHQLKSLDAPVLGVVANELKLVGNRRYGYGYGGYGYGGYGAERPSKNGGAQPPSNEEETLGGAAVPVGAGRPEISGDTRGDSDSRHDGVGE